MNSHSKLTFIRWSLATLFIVLYSLGFTLPKLFLPHGYPQVIFWIVYMVLFAPIMLIVFEFWGEMTERGIGLRFSIGEKSLKYWLVVGLVFLSVIALGINILHLFGIKLLLTLDIDSWVHYFSAFFLPIPEEILYRGIICTLVASRFNWATAILVSGIIFGCEHLVNGMGGDLTNRCIPFMIGTCMAWVFYKSRTLLLPIVFHLSFNAFNTLEFYRPDVWSKFTSFVTINF